MDQNDTLIVAERLISRWDTEGQYECETEESFYIETLTTEYNMTQDEAFQFVTENIDLDEVY